MIKKAYEIAVPFVVDSREYFDNGYLNFKIFRDEDRVFYDVKDFEADGDPPEIFRINDKGEIKSSSHFGGGVGALQKFFYPKSIKQIVNIILVQALGLAGNRFNNIINDMLKKKKGDIEADPYGEEDWGPGYEYEPCLGDQPSAYYFDYLDRIEFEGVNYE